MRRDSACLHDSKLHGERPREVVDQRAYRLRQAAPRCEDQLDDPHLPAPAEEDVHQPAGAQILPAGMIGQQGDPQSARRGTTC
jgi:hypothetical protein